jgi:hypothetical protein
MQRTPAQSAERRDQSAEQQGPPAEQRSQSEERRDQSREQRDAELIRIKYAKDIELHGPPSSQNMIILEGYSSMMLLTARAFQHLRSQAKALREAVTRSSKHSIKRQLNFLNSAFKEYQRSCEKVLEDHCMAEHAWNDDTSLLDWMMADGQRLYEEALSWADDFFDRREKEKAAHEAEALKAAKAQELQRLADNLIEDEMDAHGKVSDAENLCSYRWS